MRFLITEIVRGMKKDAKGFRGESNISLFIDALVPTNSRVAVVYVLGCFCFFPRQVPQSYLMQNELSFR